MPYCTISRTQSNRDRMTVYNGDGSSKTIEVEENVYIYEDLPVEDCVYLDMTFEVSKAREAEQLVSGWASVSVNADGSIPLDWSDDIIAPDTLEKAAIDFMLNYRDSGEMHDGDSKGTIVESIVLTKAKQEAMGIPEGTVPVGWFITVKVHDAEVFAKVKNGAYKMFSIQGKCNRVQL